MPLCPQITNTPITVTLTSDFIVTNVVPVLAANTEQLAEVAADAAAADAAATAAAAAAAAAQADADAAAALAAAADAEAAAALASATAAAAAAGVAQADATEALADAVVAYNAAIGSLQPSANTIVNASNQMTAINGGGITVYSGSSATTGARVVLNSAGLAGFNSSSTGPGNGATFSISASTGAAVFSGSVTGATITGSDLNIAGVFLVNGTTGVMTATSATVTGEIRATSGYFGTATNGWSINSTDLVGVGTGRITGGTISGTQFTNGGTFSVSPAGFLIASNAEITGTIKASAGYFGSLTNGFLIGATGLTGVGTGNITGGTISGTTFTNGSTFSVSSAGVLTASSGTVGGFTLSASSIYSSTNLVIETTGQISGGNSSTIFYGFANIGGGAATGERLIVAGDSVFNGKISTITSSFVGQMNYSGIATGSGSTMVVVTTGSRVAYTTSSERFKEQIKYINTTGWLDKVLQMQPITYKTSEDFTVEGEPNEEQIGFLAEDIYDIGGGLEKAVVLDPLGDPFSLSYDRLTVFLTLAIKELKAEINQLKGA